ncbi:uncharacterized protein ACBR49_019329 [Aulostomus maculatus]
MLCSRWVLPLLAYLLLEEISAAVLPSRTRCKRELSRLDQELFRRLLDGSDRGDLSVGDAGELLRDSDGRPFHSETPLDSAEHLSAQRQNQNQRKSHEKRRKVAPLDSISSFQMSNFRNRKDQTSSN